MTTDLIERCAAIADQKRAALLAQTVLDEDVEEREWAILTAGEIAADIRALSSPQPSEGEVERRERLEGELPAKAKAEMQLHVLDGMSDVWAEEVNLTALIKAATCPMDLNKNVPDHIRYNFRMRMEAQIDAIVRQAFVEAASRAVDMVQDAYNPIVTEYDKEIKKIRAEITEHEQSFNLRWKADMRAIERWQAEAPGRELTWPDHADLCVWLLGQLTSLQSAYERAIAVMKELIIATPPHDAKQRAVAIIAQAEAHSLPEPPKE